MTNKEILEKAIQKAIDGGWKGVRSDDFGDGKHFYYPQIELLKWKYDETTKVFYYDRYDDYESVNLEAVIYNHDFARALWGEEWKPGQYNNILNDDGTEIGLYKGGGYEGYGDYVSFEGDPWQYHLQRMVIADDPIKYLGEHI